MRPIIISLIVLTLSSCGSTQQPKVAELPLANEDATLSPGGYKEFAFLIDLNMMDSPAVIGTLATGSSTQTISLIVLNEANFNLFVANQTYEAYFDSGERTGGNINMPFTVDGTYHLILSNRASTFDTSYSLAVSLFWTER